MRQFIYSYDLAKCILWTINNYKDDKPIILSVSEGEEVSIAHIAFTIAKKFNYIDALQFDLNFADGQFKKTADNSKLLRLYSNIPEFTDIHQGINTTIEWFIENYNYSRK